MVAGIGAALVMPFLIPSVAAIYAFPYVLVISLVGCIVGSYLTEPEPDEVLIEFYMRVRPWGFWKPVCKKVQERFPEFKPNRNFKSDMFNVAVGIVWQTSLVVLPIYLVIHETTPMLIALACVLVTSVILKFTWWDNLEKASSIAVEYRPPEAIPVSGDKSLSLAGEK